MGIHVFILSLRCKLFFGEPCGECGEIRAGVGGDGGNGFLSSKDLA
jgi:hypothetical protein